MIPTTFLFCIYFYTFNSYNFRTELDASLSEAELWNIVSTQPPVENTEVTECQTITFYLIGKFDPLFRVKMSICCL